jgi:hypothetical protein
MPLPAPTISSILPSAIIVVFNEPITGSLAITMAVASSGANVPVTVAEVTSSTYSVTATGGLTPGVKYLMSVSGATAPDGLPMVPVVYPIRPATRGNTVYAGLTLKPV